MISSEDWMKQFWKPETSGWHAMKKIVEQIQLDAMKEGARRAAEEANKVKHSIHEAGCLTTMANIYDAILTTAEQWTEKDLL